MSYWDTSALAKLYVNEPDSVDFEIHAASSGLISTSETGRLELRTVLRRREAEGSLSAGSTELMHTSFCTLIAAGRFVEQAITPELAFKGTGKYGLHAGSVRWFSTIDPG
jgi:uncharacterized protein with PIN domain